MDVITYEPLPGSQTIDGAAATTAAAARITTNPSSVPEKPFRVLKEKAGTTNYKTGQLDLPSLNIAGLAGTNPVLKVGGQPRNFAEIVADKNQLLVLDNEDPLSNFVDVKLSTEGRLKSPSSVRNQSRFQSDPTPSTAPVTEEKNAAKTEESTPKPKGYPKC